MSKISKFLQISSRLLMEYVYDTKNVTTEKNVTSYVFQDNVGRVMYFMNPTSSSHIEKFYKSGFMYNAFPLKDNSGFFYPGYLYDQKSKDVILETISETLMNQNIIHNVVKGPTKIDVPMDTIRIHIATGYTFADTLGFMLRIRCQQATGGILDSSDFSVILQNFVFHKGNMSEAIKFNVKPFYQTSKFYDRYIEFQIPSAYYMALHKFEVSTSEDQDTNDIFDALNIENGAMMTFEYYDIPDEAFTPTRNEDFDNYVDLYTDGTIYGHDWILYNQGTFTVGNPTIASVELNTNADLFNAKIYEDQDNNCLWYYPIWGAVSDDRPVTRAIMNSIENGSIPLSIKGFTGNNDADLEQFEYIYGEDSRKWIVVNQIELQYNYSPMIAPDVNADNDIVRSQKFSVTEDFEEDNDNITSVDDLYKFVYRPVVVPLNGYFCRYIAVTYTARLVNRLNGEEIIRIATLNIDNAEEKYGMYASKIDVSNLYTWKLFNKIETTEVAVNTPSTGNNKTKFITKYVESLRFSMRDEDGNSNTQGNFIIPLYDTDHLYKLRIFQDANATEVYSLSNSNAEYLLRVTDANGTTTFINPTYSDNMALANGELEYKITGVQAKKILEGDRRFHIIAKTQVGVTTLFAGTFSSVFD